MGMKDFPKRSVWVTGLRTCTCGVMAGLLGCGLEVLLPVEFNLKCPSGSLVFGEEVLIIFELRTFSPKK